MHWLVWDVTNDRHLCIYMWFWYSLSEYSIISWQKPLSNWLTHPSKIATKIAERNPRTNMKEERHTTVCIFNVYIIAVTDEYTIFILKQGTFNWKDIQIDEPQKNSLLIFFIGVIFLPKDTERYRIHNLLLMKKKKDFEKTIRET